MRGILAAGMALVLYFGGIPWWAAILAGLAAMAFFLWVPRSGRYVTRAEGGSVPFRRDERSQAIAHKASRNALVTTVLALAGLAIAYGRSTATGIPVAAVLGVLGAAACTYLVSDVWLRRRV